MKLRLPKGLPLSPDVALMVLLAISVSFNVVLVYWPKAEPASRSTRPSLWSAGTVAPPLAVEDLRGNRIWLEWDRREEPTVIYIFSPDCEWCDRNLPSVRALGAQRDGRYELVAVALVPEVPVGDQVQGFDVEGVVVYAMTSAVVRAGYRLGATPQTIVIDSKGEILANWLGAYTPRLQREVEALLGVSVPAVEMR